MAVKPATLPTVVLGMGCATNALNNKVYCFGGDKVGGPSRDILEYDPTSDVLTVKCATVPGVLNTPSCMALPSTNKLYCLRGAGSSSVIEYRP
jgi:hypothetical protein